MRPGPAAARDDADIDRASIADAADRIAPHVRQTPVVTLETTSARVVCKLEMLQVSGTFKARGAFNALIAHRDAGGDPRVAAASGGNHGIAVAYAARVLGFDADIFVPETVPAAKRRTLEALGARVHMAGQEYALAYEACVAHVAAQDALLCHAYDAPATIAGQGTVAREWQAQSPELDTVLVAVGGGGLVAGVAAWCAGAPRVIGVETVGCPTLDRALAGGGPVDVAVTGIAADSLGARRLGRFAYPILQRHLAGACLVSDDDVIHARRYAWEHLRVLLEPGGATALAALLGGAYRPARGERVGVLMCGANTEARDP